MLEVMVGVVVFSLRITLTYLHEQGEVWAVIVGLHNKLISEIKTVGVIREQSLFVNFLVFFASSVYLCPLFLRQVFCVSKI